MKIQRKPWLLRPKSGESNVKTNSSILKKAICLLMLLFGLIINTFSQTTTSQSQQGHHNERILIVLSAADTWTRKDGSKYATGYWAEEFVVIHEKFVKAGYKVDIATPAGQKPTADPHSLDPKVAGPDAPVFAKYLESISSDLSHPLALSGIDMHKYIAVVVPGGHGPVVDLYKDGDMGRLLFTAEKQHKIIGTVCHGQAALLSAIDAKGKWLFKGRTLTAFSDEEEVEFGTAANAPWLLASRLRECGADYKRGEKDWAPFVIRDKNLISGQNPASSGPMADAVLKALD